MATGLLVVMGAVARAMAMSKVVVQALVAQAMDQMRVMVTLAVSKAAAARVALRVAASQAMVLKLPTRLMSLKCLSLLLKMCLGPVRRKKKSLKFSGRLGVYTIFGMGGLYILMFGVIFRIF